MAKLGEQLQQKEASQLQGRVSRTERVAQQQSAVREQKRYDTLKQKAERIKEEKLSNVTAEEYAKIYTTLDEDIKPFFATGEEVLEQKAENIANTKQQIIEKIAEIERKRQEKKEYYREKERKYRDRGDDERADKYEDRGDEYDEEYQGQIKGLQEGLKKLNQNQDVNYSDIWSYARDVGNYEQDKERARNDARRDYDEQKASGDLDEAFKQLGLNKNTTSYYNFKQAVKSYNKTIPKSNALIKQGLTPVYSGGKVAGYEDAVLGMSYSIDAYNEKYKQERSKLDIDFNADTGMLSVKPNADAVYQDYVDNKKIVLYSDPKTEPTAFTMGNKTYVPQSDFIGYVDQGTISTEPKYVEIPANIDYKKPDINAGFKWLGKQYAKIPKGEWNINIGGLTGFGLSPYKDPLAIKSFIVTEKIGDAREWLQGGGSDVDQALQDLKVVEPKLSAIDTKYQEQGQARFENLYAKDIIYGDITPEKAQEEFMKTESYKIWQDQYAEEYGKEFESAIARENIGFGSAFKYGSKKFLYSTGDFVLGRIETPKATAETGAVVGGIVLTYGQLSPAVASAVGWGLTGATGVYGAYKTFDPSSTPSEVFGGSVMLGTAVASAGYGAYRYLNKPVVNTVKIKAPKNTLKASQTKGYDVKYITKDGTLNKVVYQNQKLSQIGVAGRRTTVTTKFRALSNKYLKTNLKNIYEGVPTQQLAKSYTVQGLRGSYTYTAGKSGYQKAYDLLRKYGYSKYQASATLRYTAPRVYDQYLRSGEIIVKGNKAVGGLKFETVRPVIDVDKSLGIKTRGGGTTRDYTLVKRQLLQDAKGNKFILENQLTNTYGINLKGIKSFKQVQEKWNLGVAKASETQTGLDAIRLNKELTLYEKITYKDVLSGSKTFMKGTGTISKDLVKLNIELMPKDISASRTILIDKVKDLTKGSQGIKFTGGAKTPLAKTFGISDNVDDVINQIGKVKPTAPSKDIAKVIDKLDDIKVTSPSGSPAQQSQYYGQGVYERSAGGVSPQQMQLLQNELKTLAISDVKVNVLKDVLRVKMGTDVKVLSSVASLNAIDVKVLSSVASLNAMLRLKTGLKQDYKLKTDLKAQTDLKNLIKTDVMVKTATATDLAVKTSPALKTQLKSLLDLNAPAINLNTPAFKTPTIPSFNTPIPKAFVIPFLKDKISKKAGRGSRQVSDYVYLPDFTSRALGLQAETISEKQAQKKLKKLLTGLEIRRGVKIQ